MKNSCSWTKRTAGCCGIIWPSRICRGQSWQSGRFTLDKTDPRAFDDFIAAARGVPEVVAIETFLGRVDVRLNVIARDMAQYQEVYRQRILGLPHIAEVDALMLIATVKDAEALPL